MFSSVCSNCQQCLLSLHGDSVYKREEEHCSGCQRQESHQSCLLMEVTLSCYHCVWGSEACRSWYTNLAAQQVLIYRATSLSAPSPKLPDNGPKPTENDQKPTDHSPQSLALRLQLSALSSVHFGSHLSFSLSFSLRTKMCTSFSHILVISPCYSFSLV